MPKDGTKSTNNRQESYNEKVSITKEEIKEVELLNSLSYDDIVEYVKNKPITESKDNVIKDLDLTYEEFMATYDAVDLTNYLNSLGIKLGD